MNSELRSESDIGSGLFRLPKTDSKIILGTKYDKSNKCLYPILILGLRGGIRCIGHSKRMWICNML